MLHVVGKRFHTFGGEEDTNIEFISFTLTPTAPLSSSFSPHLLFYISSTPPPSSAKKKVAVYLLSVGTQFYMTTEHNSNDNINSSYRPRKKRRDKTIKLSLQRYFPIDNDIGGSFTNLFPQISQFLSSKFTKNIIYIPAYVLRHTCTKGKSQNKHGIKQAQKEKKKMKGERGNRSYWQFFFGWGKTERGFNKGLKLLGQKKP